MAEFGRTPDLDAVARSDRLLDALAAGRPVTGGDPADRALTDLMAGWRDELRWPPATGLVAESQAVEALERGRPVHPRSRRSFAVIGSVAATVLGLGGFGAVLSTAQPGDALYGLRSSLFGEPPSVRDDQVVLAAQTEFAKVQQMIADGQWDQAQQVLAEVSDSVQTVNDAGRKQDLIDQWNELNVKVEHQDPEATVPPSANLDPGVPPVSSTSVSVSVSTTPASETTPTSPASESPSATTTTAPSSTMATPTTSTPPSATTAVPTTTAVPSTTAVPTTTVVPTTTTAPPSEAPASAAAEPAGPTTPAAREQESPAPQPSEQAEQPVTEPEPASGPAAESAAP